MDHMQESHERPRSLWRWLVRKSFTLYFERMQKEINLKKITMAETMMPQNRINKYVMRSVNLLVESVKNISKDYGEALHRLKENTKSVERKMMNIDNEEAKTNAKDIESMKKLLNKLESEVEKLKRKCNKKSK